MSRRDGQLMMRTLSLNRKITQLALAFLLAASSASAQAANSNVDSNTAWNSAGAIQDEALRLIPNLDNGRKAYRKSCANCHLPEGWGPIDGTLPQIAGQHYTVIIKQLADIRSGIRVNPNPTMFPFAQPEQIGGPQAIADVAAYIEQLKMNPQPFVGKGNDLKYGAIVYEKYCTECHGTKGDGDADRFYPRIQGQNYSYLMRQYKWIKERKRTNASQKMWKNIKDLDQRKQEAVLDYISRLKPDSRLLGSPDWRNPDFEE